MTRPDSFVVDDVRIRVQRSQRRSRTITLRPENGGAVLMVPVGLSAQEEIDVARKLWTRLERRRQRGSDEDLACMADAMNRQYFGGRLQWTAISYSERQEKRFGSCTPARSTIRISSRVASLPVFVQRYVVVHELAHLIHPNHGPAFWEAVNAYPLTERARGYLMALGLENDLADSEADPAGDS